MKNNKLNEKSATNNIKVLITTLFSKKGRVSSINKMNLFFGLTTFVDKYNDLNDEVEDLKMKNNDLKAEIKNLKETIQAIQDNVHLLYINNNPFEKKGN